MQAAKTVQKAAVSQDELAYPSLLKKKKEKTKQKWHFSKQILNPSV